MRVCEVRAAEPPSTNITTIYARLALENGMLAALLELHGVAWSCMTVSEAASQICMQEQPAAACKTDARSAYTELNMQSARSLITTIP
jgi:hypothetical protein